VKQDDPGAAQDLQNQKVSTPLITKDEEKMEEVPLGMGGPTAAAQGANDFPSMQQSTAAGVQGSAQKPGRRGYQKKRDAAGGGKRGQNKNPQSSKAESQIGETNSADQSVGVVPSGAQSIQQDFVPENQGSQADQNNPGGRPTQGSGASGEEGKNVVIVAPSTGNTKKRGQAQSQGEKDKVAGKASRQKTTVGDEKNNAAPKQGSKSKD